jgi:hypothetical protein
LRRRQHADDALAFVSLLKRSVSTISACLQTLRVVADRLERHETAASLSRAAQRERARALRAWRRRVARFGSLDAASEANQAELEIESMTEALRSEPDSELAHVIRLGMAAEPHDPKLATLLMEVRLIRARHPRTNILIYTEYTDSQLAAAQALKAVRGEVLTIGGQDDDHARGRAAQRFADCDGLILISTDSLAEGLNLHRHCFHLIHLDLPYNPNRLEQRNGRIDRYGQQHEPLISYLYVPGTFEESLLLHLIRKYENARSCLDVMPDTLGATAEEDDYRTPLTKGLSEDPDDLFHSGPEIIRTLDRAAGDSSPEVVATLLRDIDRAFDSFELSAVSHGWRGARGINAGMEQLIKAGSGTEDLAGFVGAVADLKTGRPATGQDEIRLPAEWVHGLDYLPGYDAKRGILGFTRDPELHDEMAYLGHAHPLVLRAIREGCRLPGAVSVASGGCLGLLLTFEIGMCVSKRAMFRQVIAIMAEPDRPPVEINEWLTFDTAEISYNDAWDRWFESWASPILPQCREIASTIAKRRQGEFDQKLKTSKQQEMGRIRRWLGVRANLLCGSFVPATADLFGAPQTGPVWRRQKDPLARLTSFAADPESPASKRREANDTLDLFRAIEAHDAVPGPILTRPLGMLMLVPKDAF